MVQWILKFQKFILKEIPFCSWNGFICTAQSCTTILLCTVCLTGVSFGTKKRNENWKIVSYSSNKEQDFVSHFNQYIQYLFNLNLLKYMQTYAEKSLNLEHVRNIQKKNKKNTRLEWEMQLCLNGGVALVVPIFSSILYFELKSCCFFHQRDETAQMKYEPTTARKKTGLA